jgi:hypothetical protein
MRRRQRTVAETQTAGFGLATGKVVQLLILEFHDEPAITVRHEHVDHPDSFDDRDPRTTTVEEATVRPTADSLNRKIEIGTAHGRDRVIAESHDHSVRVYVRHEREDGGWTEQSAWELHPATGITQVAGEASTDGGQVLNETERREKLAYGGVCPVCGDEFTDGFERLKDLEGESIEGVRICVIDPPEENLFHLPEDQADHSGDTETNRCINCGDEIQGDGVYTQSGVKSDGHERLQDGESVKVSNLMEMDDGPYCSLDCSVDTGTDQETGDDA